jgi:hypothetical protein
MLVLLGISTLGAALVPAPEQPDETTTTSSSAPPTPFSSGGELLRERIRADSDRPRTIRVPLGDQLALAVGSKRFGQIQIPRLGLIEDVAPLAPARFDILAQTEGRFDVMLTKPQRRVAILEFGKPGG